MKVLALIDSLSYGGAEKLLATLAGAVEPRVFELSVLSLAPASDGRTQMLPTLRAAGLSVDFADVSRLADPTAVPRLARRVRRSGCDVLHAHLGYSAILGPPAARLSGVPSVATLHHVPQDLVGRDRIKERAMVEVPGRLGALVFVSQAARDEFARRYRDRPSWRVVHNGIDLSRFVAGADGPLDVPGLPSGVPVVSIVAALREPKGHVVALEAWPRVLGVHPEARLLIVGDGPHRGSIESDVRRLGLEHRVVMTGSRDDVPDIMRRSDLVALPTFTEALPTVLVEAAAVGTPVVASRVGGVPETVVHGTTGLLVPPRNPGAFADAVVRLLSSPDERRAMGAAGRHLAESHFDVLVWRDRLVSLYREMGAG